MHFAFANGLAWQGTGCEAGGCGLRAEPDRPQHRVGIAFEDTGHSTPTLQVMYVGRALLPVVSSVNLLFENLTIDGQECPSYGVFV